MDWSIIIKNLRYKLLLTQEEFASLMGVSYATVNRWENKRFEPTMKQKRAIKELCIKNSRIFFSRTR